MKNLKVALLLTADAMGAPTGGVRNYMNGLYQGLSKNDVGIDVSFLKSPERFLGMGAGTAFFFDNLLKSFADYDVFHNPGTNLLVPLAKNGCVSVTTVHDMVPVMYPELNPERNASIKNMLWYEMLVRRAYLLALKSDFIISRSTQTTEEILKFGYDRKRITVISDSIKDMFIKAPQSHVKPCKFRVGYLGGLGKNVDFAARAIGMIEDQNVEFRLYGNKKAMPSSLEWLIEHDRRIKFMGFVPEDKVVQAYDSLDAFVYPSMHEGFGAPIIEAQARGVPVVLNYKGMIPKEVRKYCFEAKDEWDMAQILKKIRANGYNQKMRRKAIEYARTFTWGRQISETLEVYRKAAG